MNGQDLSALLRLSLTQPIEGGQAILRLNPDRASRWTLLFVAIVVGVLLAFLPPLMLGRTAEIPTPITVLAMQVGVNLAMVGLIFGVGRMMGGTGNFDDAVLMTGAMQAIMLVLQVPPMVAAFVVPPLEFPLVMVAVGMGFWVITGFICALHGFVSQIKVLLGFFLTVIIASFMVGVVLLILGVEVPGMPADV